MAAGGTVGGPCTGCAWDVQCSTSGQQGRAVYQAVLRVGSPSGQQGRVVHRVDITSGQQGGQYTSVLPADRPNYL